MGVCVRVPYLNKTRQYRMEHFQSNGAGPVFFSFIGIFIFKVKFLAFDLICEYLGNGDRLTKRYYCHHIGSHV